MTYTIAKIEKVQASGAGALAHYKAKCSCGLTMRNTMETGIRADVAAHYDYHTKPGQKWSGSVKVG